MKFQVQAGLDIKDQSTSEKLLGGIVHFTGRWNKMVKNGNSSKTCGWLLIRQQEFYSSTLLAHKIVTTGLPHNLWSELVQPHTVRTRAASQGQIKFGDNYRGTSEFIRSSFKYRVQRYYSKIPSDMKKLPLEVFKTKLKQYSFRNIPIK